MVEVDAANYDLGGDEHDDDPLELVGLLVVEDLKEELGVTLHVVYLVLHLGEALSDRKLIPQVCRVVVVLGGLDVVGGWVKSCPPVV